MSRLQKGITAFVLTFGAMLGTEALRSAPQWSFAASCAALGFVVYLWADRLFPDRGRR